MFDNYPKGSYLCFGWARGSTTYGVSARVQAKGEDITIPEDVEEVSTDPYAWKNSDEYYTDTSAGDAWQGYDYTQNADYQRLLGEAQSHTDGNCKKHQWWIQQE